MVDKLREAGRMAERGADNIFHELVRDPNWQPTRADYTSIGHLLRNIAGTAGNRATAANGEQAERDKLKTAYLALLKISQDDDGSIGRYAAKIARAVEPDATLRTPANGEQVERVTPALHEGGRFLQWSSVDLAAQCLTQAREQLDPEFSQFMTVVAARLAATPTEDARERVKVLEEALERLSSSFRGNWAGMFRERTDVIEAVEKIAQEALLTYRARTALGNKETDRHG